MNRFFHWMHTTLEAVRKMPIYVVYDEYWQDDVDGWEPVGGEEYAFFYPSVAVMKFWECVKDLREVENVYKEGDVLTVYGDGSTASIQLWFELPDQFNIRYRVLRGQTIFTCGTEEEVFNYLKGATGKDLDQDTLVIDGMEYVERQYRNEGAKFRFHFAGTEGIESYIEIYDPRPDWKPQPNPEVSDGEEQMPF